MLNARDNANRFSGFADTYENARPVMPYYPVAVIHQYLGKNPETVVDLGCGTGLSTLVWEGNCKIAVGVEPNEDMLTVARTKQKDNLSFRKAFANETGLPNNFAEAIICSQSFHWMEPVQTLAEINRILKSGGIFATVDCDWPPVCNWGVEKAYCDLFKEVNEIERQIPKIGEQYHKWDKNKHLSNIEQSGYFRFVREIVFSNEEKCDSNRFINIALSQGGLQNALKEKPELILSQIEKFKETVVETFDQKTFNISFCYRMRIGVK